MRDVRPAPCLRGRSSRRPSVRAPSGHPATRCQCPPRQTRGPIPLSPFRTATRLRCRVRPDAFSRLRDSDDARVPSPRHPLGAPSQLPVRIPKS
ncbi:putative vegetative cell wall protein gp1-like isoform X4 [Iris pallida]|uniref:Vegetative cell wall protein gp1-like isoform X4 n=1 Tax=Iris pallida TaxID=29817 RepID=A0AAX6HL08_IRIPA|nr:putative vegetative cell wall protein gp1-like isoform X4 [Iris pallida]